MYHVHRAKFHDSAINFYVQILRLKFVKSMKKAFKKYSIERLANKTRPLGVVLWIAT